MEIIRDIPTLRKIINGLRKEGKRIGFVPTMGALHEGHLSLTKLAREHADVVVVSIFVNPTQFGQGEDFSVYPRTEEEDCKKLESCAVEYVYVPDVKAIYPEGFSTTIQVSGVSEGLCGAVRPHFFGGVAIVVTKLLMQVMPDIAIFGEKDYQQLQVIKRLAKDLDMPIEIMGGAIIRESDGLAMSSRNRYLNKEQRRIAPVLYKTLCDIKNQLKQGANVKTVLAKATQEMIDQGIDLVDYIELHHADTLALLDSYTAPARLLAGVRIGTCRLIDNIEA